MELLWITVFVVAMGSSPVTTVHAADAVASPAINKKVAEHKRVQAKYWSGGYFISEADAKDQGLGKKKDAKKKPAIKPIAKK